MPRSGAVRVAAASAARLVSGSETPGTARAKAMCELRHFFHRWAFPWVSISRGSAQGREPSPSLAWLKTKSSSRSPRRVNPPHPSPALCGVPRAFFPSPWGSFAPRGAPGARLPAGSTAQAVLTGSIPAVGPPPGWCHPPCPQHAAHSCPHAGAAWHLALPFPVPAAGCGQTRGGHLSHPCLGSLGAPR